MHKSVILAAALAALILSPADATAETVGTGCLSKLGGEIYALAPYRSAPSKKCRTGDQRVRLQLHQPNTAIAKRSGHTGKLPDGELVRFADDIAIAIGGFDDQDHGNGCTLSVSHLANGYFHRLIQVPPGSWQHGIREVIAFESSEEIEVARYQSDGLVIIYDSTSALLFHDAFVDARGGDCFAAIVVEWASDQAELYAK